MNEKKIAALAKTLGIRPGRIVAGEGHLFTVTSDEPNSNKVWLYWVLTADEEEKHAHEHRWVKHTKRTLPNEEGEIFWILSEHDGVGP